MKRVTVRNSVMITAITFAALLILCRVFGGSFWPPVALHRMLNWGLYRGLAQVVPGMQEEEALRAMGRPSFTITQGDDQRFPVPGYYYDGHPMSAKVLVYYGEFDAIAYIYIGASGKVEHISAGGS